LGANTKSTKYSFGAARVTCARVPRAGQQRGTFGAGVVLPTNFNLTAFDPVARRTMGDLGGSESSTARAA
jgi:hypothetical protein